jgi:ADP-ribosylglycohydrolase
MVSSTRCSKHDRVTIQRAEAGLQSLYVGDSLAMPVHWYYNPMDILKAFPGGIQHLEDAPAYHPSSIMSLHSTAKGGRGRQGGGAGREIVGKVILKDKRSFWGLPNQHYHQGMKAGENTLNAHCARVVTRSITAAGGCYDKAQFLSDYIDFMTAVPARHPDTYAESFHRGFFANLERGKAPAHCGAVTHDTPSVGGLVMLGPIAISGFLQNKSLEIVQDLCREHLFLTHPDALLARISDAFVQLVQGLLFRKNDEPLQQIIADTARQSVGLDLKRLALQGRSDNEVAGGRYSTACYITDSWPVILYLAYTYAGDLKAALLANTNLGGDNVHRGAVLGLILGLGIGRTVDLFFNQLADRQATHAEITGLIGHIKAINPTQ